MIGNPAKYGGRIVAIVVFLAATACSSGSHNAKSTSTTVDSPTTSTTTVEDTVVVAWRHYWDIYVAVASEMKLPDARLAEVATGEELRQLGGGFLAFSSKGEIFKGTIDLDPKVVSITGSTATLRDCYLSAILGYDKATGKPEGSAPTQRTLVTVTLQLEGGVWKVAAIKHEGEGCTSAS